MTWSAFSVIRPPMATTLRSIPELQAAGLVSAADATALQAVASRYAVAITPAMVALIDHADAHDPIARQFVPDARELQHRPEELADPIGDERFARAPGVVHRYPDRVLLKLTHVCPVYCRFCFRRETVGPGGPQALSGESLNAALAYIAGDPRIWEVILTGGDPFMLAPDASPRSHAGSARCSTSRCCAGTRACRWSRRSASRPISSTPCARPAEASTSPCTPTIPAS